MKFTIIAASLLASGALLASPAAAQNDQPAAAPAEAWTPKFSKADTKALQPVQAAVQAKDWAAATAAVTAAQGAVSGADAKYYLGNALVEIGRATNNDQLQSQGLDAMIASGGGDPGQAALRYKAQGTLALQAKDYAKAETALSRWAQLAPNDPAAQTAVAELKFRQKKPQEALPLFERAIAARKASGQPVPESWYLLALQSALDAKMAPQTKTWSRTLLDAYPNPKN
jgi:tetratricopeptide (TPR) repeat protein